MKKEISSSNSTHPAKKPFYKKWWFIVIIVILVIGVIGAMSGGQDTGVQNNQPSSQADDTKAEEEANYVEPGMYKIGTDLDSGTYLIFGMGYMALSKDSSGELDSLIVNDNYINTRYTLSKMESIWSLQMVGPIELKMPRKYSMTAKFLMRVCTA